MNRTSFFRVEDDFDGQGRESLGSHFPGWFFAGHHHSMPCLWAERCWPCRRPLRETCAIPFASVMVRKSIKASSHFFQGAISNQGRSCARRMDAKRRQILNKDNIKAPSSIRLGTPLAVQNVNDMASWKKWELAFFTGIETEQPHGNRYGRAFAGVMNRCVV